LNTNVLQETATQWHQRALQQAAAQRLLHSAQTGQRNRLYGQPRQLVRQLGHTLIHFGQWLEQRATQTV
jgi:hypothetical protein